MHKDVYQLVGRRTGRQAGFFRQHAKLASILITGLVVGGSMAGVVFATIPDNNGTVHACYNTTKGDLRVIDSPSQQCKGGETAIDLATPVGNNGVGIGQLVTSNLSNGNLSGLDMRYRNFHGVNFTNATLNGVGISHSDVGGADFSGAQLIGAQVTDQDLSTATLTNANFISSIFIGVSFGSNNLTGTDFRLATMNNVSGLAGRDFVNGGFAAGRIQFSNMNLSGANFAGSDFTPPLPPVPNFGFAQFTNVNLTNADFTGATRSNVNEGTLFFDGSNLTGAKFINVVFPGHVNFVSFANTTGTGADFSGADIRGADFSGANLTNPNFTSANVSRGAAAYQLYPYFNGTTLTNPNFTNTDLSTAHGMDTATIANPTWSNTTCPDGSNSNANGGTCVGHLTPAL